MGIIIPSVEKKEGDFHTPEEEKGDFQCGGFSMGDFQRTVAFCTP